MDSKFDRGRSINLSQARTSRWLQALFYLLFSAYGLFTLQVILFKTVPFAAIFYHAGERSIRSINWIPFYTIAEFFTSPNMGMGRALLNVGGISRCSSLWGSWRPMQGKEGLFVCNRSGCWLPRSCLRSFNMSWLWAAAISTIFY